MANEFLSDLMRATDFLKGNIAEIKMRGTMDKALQATNQIKTQVADEQEQRAQLQQVSQALTVDLMKYGAPADSIATLAQQIAPQRMFQTAEQALINPDMASPDQRNAAQGIYEDEMSLKHDTLKAKRVEAQTKAQERLDSRMFKAVESGQKRVDSLAKKSLAALDSSDTMIELLDSGNPIADQSVQTFAVKASGEVGNLTKDERRPYGSSQAIHRRLAAYASKAATGRLTDADRKDLRQLAELFASSAKRNVRRHQEQVGKQIAANLGVKPEQVFEKLIPDYMPSDQSQTQGQTQGSQGVTTKRMRDKKTGQVVEVQFDANGKPVGIKR